MSRWPISSRIAQASACFLASLLIPALSGGCKNTPAQQNAPAGSLEQAVPVAVASVEQRDVPVQVRAIGTVEPYRTVAIKSQVQGELTEIRFQEGQYVNEGDVLFVIDKRPYEVALRLAEATLAKDLALAKDAEEEAKWMASLLGNDAAAQRESEKSRAAADAAWAQVEADRAAVDNAKLNLGYCTIPAPFEGYTGSLMVHRGAILKARETDLVVLNQVKPIYVTFSVPESQLGDIKSESSASTLDVDASFPGQSGPPLHGTLSFLDNQADRTTGMIRLRGTFTNEDKRLWPGQFVNVALTLTTERGAILAPTQAIQTGQTGQYAFVVKNDQTVEMRQVEARHEVNGWTVVASGLEAGQTVVTDGQLRLVPGTTVRIKTTASGQAVNQAASTNATSAADQADVAAPPTQAATQPATASGPSA